MRVAAIWRLCVIVASKNRRLYRLSPKLTLLSAIAIATATTTVLLFQAEGCAEAREKNFFSRRKGSRFFPIKRLNRTE